MPIRTRQPLRPTNLLSRYGSYLKDSAGGDAAGEGSNTGGGTASSSGDPGGGGFGAGPGDFSGEATNSMTGGSWGGGGVGAGDVAAQLAEIEALTGIPNPELAAAMGVLGTQAGYPAGWGMDVGIGRSTGPYSGLSSWGAEQLGDLGSQIASGQIRGDLIPVGMSFPTTPQNVLASFVNAIPVVGTILSALGMIPGMPDYSKFGTPVADNPAMQSVVDRAWGLTDLSDMITEGRFDMGRIGMTALGEIMGAMAQDPMGIGGMLAQGLSRENAMNSMGFTGVSGNTPGTPGPSGPADASGSEPVQSFQMPQTGRTNPFLSYLETRRPMTTDRRGNVLSNLGLDRFGQPV